VLHSGSNTLNLDVPVMSGVTIETFWVDGLKIRSRLGGSSMGNEASFSVDASPSNVSYQIQLNSPTGLAIYNVTNPLSPIRLTDLRIAGSSVTFGDAASTTAQSYAEVNANGIHIPAQIRALKPLVTAASTGADYIIIAPEGYDTVLQPLVKLRTDQNLKVVIEHLQPIYDQFNEGRLDPIAIRNYLKYTYTNSTIKPTYVLLVGDGTIDPKMYRPTDFLTILPPILMDVDPYTTDSASDNHFVNLDDDIDNLPNMIIGRLPAISTAEAKIMVDKIVNYETQQAPGW
jgi:hypothetical protein